MTVATHPPNASSTLAKASPRGSRERRRFAVHGVVQGVGFRPFVWNLASRMQLSGWVRNTSGAVVIEVEGEAPMIETFATALGSDAPRLARVETVDMTTVDVTGERGFHIVESRSCRWGIPADRTRRRDLYRVRQRHPHAGNRRHGYAFTNCTNCGPRFTIIEDIPYDRPLTTMRHFTMCTACQQEYEDPRNRRFHAQPNACPACGPRLWYADAGGEEITGDPINLAAASIASGEIVALKGLGGFQLCCDATCEAAVTRLRDRKHRPAKPFAVMLPTIAAVRRICHVSDEEAALLEGSARPIVLLQRTGSGARESDAWSVAGSVAPGLAGARRDVAVHADAPPAHARSVGAARHGQAAM